MKIGKIEAVKATTSPKDLDISYRQFVIQNLSEAAVVYFKEKSSDGKNATQDNGFALQPGETMDMLLRAITLSIVASAEADVRVMYVE